MQQSTGSFSSSSSGIVMAISSVTPSTPTSWPSFRTQLRLTIVNVTAKDYGAYRCVAKNPFGEADGVITFHHTQSASTTTVSYPRNPAPPVAAVSPELMQEMNQEGINSNQSHNMKLAGPSSAGKGRFSDNMLPDNNNDPLSKDLSNKSQKTRSGDTKWSFSWDPNAPGAKSGCADLTSTHPVWILVVTVMWLTRITSAVSAGSTRASSLMTARWFLLLFFLFSRPFRDKKFLCLFFLSFPWWWWHNTKTHFNCTNFFPLFCFAPNHIPFVSFTPPSPSILCVYFYFNVSLSLFILCAVYVNHSTFLKMYHLNVNDEKKGRNYEYPKRFF